MNKKDLMGQFGVSLNTVKTTMRNCGLDPNQNEYTQEEVEIFGEARRLLDEGKKYHQVAEHFGVDVEKKKPAGGKKGGASNVPLSPAMDELFGAIGEGGSKMGQVAAEMIVEQLTPLLPHMVSRALIEKARSGSIEEAFDSYVAQIRGANSSYVRQDPVDAPGLPGEFDDFEPDDEGDEPDFPDLNGNCNRFD